MAHRIVEIKRHGDGSEHRYDCELVSLRPHLAIVLLRHWRERSAGGFQLLRGSRTYGFFWPRRGYSLYRMLNRSGGIIAHRFDVLEDCRIGESEVSYLDLLLDMWVAPDGSVQIEDEEDVAAWAEAGLLSNAQQRHITRMRALLLRDCRRICNEAGRLLDDVTD